jgi:hypothetical protein
MCFSGKRSQNMKEPGLAPCLIFKGDANI